MFNNIFFAVIMISFTTSFIIKPIYNKNILYSLRYIDHDMENKTVFDKFEYYSILGDREKQKKYLEEILQLNRTESN